MTTTWEGLDVPAAVQAAVYARISSDDGTALGVTRQLADCIALAERKDWTVAEVFTDNDVSATSGRPRPQYERMMQALAAGRLGALVVWDVDRLTRTPRELEDVVDLAERRGVALASVGGEIDLATPQGRLTARIKGNVAKHESEQLARRVKRKMAERAEAGQPHGRIAYGWRREQAYDDQGRRLGSKDVLHPEQADVIRTSAAAVLAGESLRAIVARLNSSGEVTLNSKPWTSTTLRLILLRERNIARRVHQGRVIGRGEWEPVFDEDTFDRITSILTDPSRRTSPASSAVKYLLSGIARCGVCSGPMRVLIAGAGRTLDSYVCQQNYHLRRQRQALDDFVTAVIVARLGRPDAADLLSARDDGQGHQIREQAQAVRARLDLAADTYAEGGIDGPQLTRITAKLRPELERLEMASRALSTAPDLLDLVAPDIAERWELLPLARQRSVINLLMTVVVLPSTKRGGAAAHFDPTSVEITWRTT